MKKLVRRSWDALPLPDTVIAQVKALRQGKLNNLDFIDYKKCPIGDPVITGLDSGDEALYIDLIEPETGLDPITSGTETLLELVEYKNIPTIKQERDMGITK